MHLPENARNEAQEARNVSDDEVKRLADMPSVHGGETWGKPSGHSGTHSAWFVSGVILAGFILGAFGFTIGPHVLLWIAVGVIVVTAAYGMVTHAWSDYRVVRETDPAGEGDQDGNEAGPANTGTTRRSS